MAYRGESPDNVCARHPAAVARGECEQCGSSLCECCILYDGANALCRDCVAERGRRRRLFKKSALTALVAVLFAGAGFVYAGTARARAVMHERELSHRVRLLGTTVDIDRCNTKANVDLVTALREAGDDEEVNERVHEYCFQCAHHGDKVPWACPTPPPGLNGLVSPP